jgi:hypothetical protein
MLDLKAVVAATGYHGTNAVADGIVKLAQVGADTVLSVDPDGSGSHAAHALVTLQNVTASALKADVDFLWH